MQSTKPTDNLDHDEFYHRADYHDDQRPNNPIGAVYDAKTGAKVIVEFNGRTLAQILNPESLAKKTKTRGVSDVSFKDVNSSCGISPDLAYTIKQAAEFLQLSQDAVTRNCRVKFWKCSRQPNAYRIKGSVILNWLEGK